VKLGQILALVQELASARGPCGQEDEVREIVLRELGRHCDRVWTDEAENAVGLIRGRSPRGAKGRPAPVVQVMAHMDELSLIVKRVEADGSLRVRQLGGLAPWAIGLGPVEILGDRRRLPGVLSVGSLHTTAETPEAWRSKVTGEGRTVDWPQVRVFTRLGTAELAAAGVHPGTRVVIGQAARQFVEIQDCVAGRFMDDRAPLAAMVAAAAQLAAARRRPAADVYLVGTCGEELGNGPAPFSAGSLGAGISLALEVGPVAGEYGTVLSADPIVVYRDRRVLYSKAVADRLVEVGRSLGMHPQRAVYESYGTDASAAQSSGRVPRSGALCIPTDNTHGCEVIAKAGLANCARLLAAYLQAPVG